MSELHLMHTRAGLQSKPDPTKVTSRKQRWSCVKFRIWDEPRSTTWIKRKGNAGLCTGGDVAIPDTCLQGVRWASMMANRVAFDAWSTVHVLKPFKNAPDATRRSHSQMRVFVRRAAEKPNVPLKLDNVLCLDFEASALGPGSYPIEVAVVDCGSTACRAWLIGPTPDWLTSGIWSDASAAVHKIPFSDLMTHGQPARQVATELATFCSGKTVLCDGGEHDWRWLVTLYAASELRPPFELLDHHAYAWHLAERSGRRPEVAVNRSEWEALSRFPLLHRAGPDARRLAETLRLIAGYP